MKTHISFFTVLMIVGSFSQIFGQTFEVPANYAFKTKADYARYEPEVIQAVKWLENVPLNQEDDKRKQAYLFVFTYVQGSPTVSIELQRYVTDISGKNPELLIAFLGGWTKYKLENPDVNDPLVLNTEGMKTILKIYKLGGAVKDKNLEKLAKLSTDQELQDWVKGKIKS
jgi:hypothetical protein